MAQTDLVLDNTFLLTNDLNIIMGGRCGDHTGFAIWRYVVQIPLEEEKCSPFRFFFWREPLNFLLPLERMFKSPSKEAASLYTNQVWVLYLNQEDDWF